MYKSDFHHVSRVKAYVTQMFSSGKVDNAFIDLRSGTRLHGQLLGTTTGTENNSVKLRSQSGMTLSVDMREIVNMGYELAS